MKESKFSCICQICNCGRHKCPHFTKLVEPKGICEFSEYKTQYKPQNAMPREPIRPPRQPVALPGIISSDTTQRLDFREFDLPEKYVHNKVSYKPPDQPFEGASSYTDAYVPKGIERVKPIKPKARLVEESKFDGRATYKNDYQQWDMSRSKRDYIIPENNLHANAGVFEGNPTYKDDFQTYNAAPPQSCKPQHSYVANNEAFSSTTGYRNEYVPHNITREGLIKPLHNKVLSSGPFQSSTTNKDDYTAKESVPTLSFKPPQKSVNTEAPLSSDTTTRQDYRAWTPERTRPIVHANEYTTPKAEFNGSTTYGGDFISRNVDVRAQPIKHKDNQQLSDTPFSGNSSYKQEYQKWDSKPNKPIIPDSQYRRSSQPFEGESTAKAHFVPHQSRPAMPIRPSNNNQMNAGEMEKSTSYRMEYTQKESQPCPAALLETKASNYVFKEQDMTSGHKFYAAEKSGQKEGMVSV